MAFLSGSRFRVSYKMGLGVYSVTGGKVEADECGSRELHLLCHHNFNQTQEEKSRVVCPAYLGILGVVVISY